MMKIWLDENHLFQTTITHKKKTIFTFLSFLLSMIAYTQITPATETKRVKVAEQLKSNLVSKEGLSAKAADKIVNIEAEFFNGLNAIDAERNLSTRDRGKKLSEAHAVRRIKLMEILLNDPQMEDVIYYPGRCSLGINYKYFRQLDSKNSLLFKLPDGSFSFF